jgi:hypothetical protein
VIPEKNDNGRLSLALRAVAPTQAHADVITLSDSTEVHARERE